jgi:hypothetical protein
MPTKPKTKTDEEPDETIAGDEVDPDYRFSGLAEPPVSDPLHPDYVEWQHEHAGGPSPEELEAIHLEQDKAAESEAEARATVAEATPEPEAAAQ